MSNLMFEHKGWNHTDRLRAALNHLICNGTHQPDARAAVDQTHAIVSKRTTQLAGCLLVDFIIA